MKRLIGSHVTGKIKCSVFRQATDIQSIQKIDDSTEEKDRNTNNFGSNSVIDDPVVQKQSKQTISVVGSFGTKIENVVICALKIMQDDPENKFIIFSQWEDVLDIAEKAFNETIYPMFVRSGKKLASSLNRFKHDPFVNALLLPIKKGANGLNLIEATHVILIDSIVSKAVESQAIGRIHRIGQSKETMVHRFIVEDTIEEKIDALQKSKSETDLSSQKRRNLKTDARLTGEELRILFEC